MKILSMIQKRLSSKSNTNHIFEKIKIQNEKTLKNSGFKTPLSYVKDNFKTIYILNSFLNIKKPSKNNLNLLLSEKV